MRAAGRLGPIWLADDVTRGNALAFLYAAFFSVCLLSFLSFMQPFVLDAHLGIPRSQLKRVFNRFYRFQSRGYKVKGTGLGLFIVRSIARQHGGRVFADSEGEGQGATFTLELPRSTAQTIAAEPVPGLGHPVSGVH